jgi:hypothetical protein
MIPSYNAGILQRVYEDAPEEWINFDEANPCLLENEQFVVIDDLTIKKEE